MKLRTLIVINDEDYVAVITEVKTDSRGLPFATAFRLYGGGEEVDLDSLSDEVMYLVYWNLDDKLDAAYAAELADAERAEHRARWKKVFKP